jgi:hypothetical protein
MPRAFSSGAASIWSYALNSPPNFSRQDLGDRSRQRGLAVVDVADGADVDVRLGAFELTFAMCSLPGVSTSTFIIGSSSTGLAFACLP